MEHCYNIPYSKNQVATNMEIREKSGGGIYAKVRVIQEKVREI